MSACHLAVLVIDKRKHYESNSVALLYVGGIVDSISATDCISSPEAQYAATNDCATFYGTAEFDAVLFRIGMKLISTNGHVIFHDGRHFVPETLFRSQRRIRLKLFPSVP